ncbi:hypothetical protein MRB53_026727 [Persea americana]|uniref:Uncharacterized protein n=1 Tax=Persea americana TaxID=3435 RepID=A0ACC2LIY4_PERAE|nr:hypothetical protein MRB53_026727 [Persea americana]
MKEVLNFDYTKVNPAAVVPIISYDGVSCGLGRRPEKIEIGKRAIPAYHQLQVTVSLILPESEYNRKIGVFQVRVEFLSSDGNVSSASSQPCMLWFKSLPIHFLETLLKSGPLLFGYSSESQILNLKMTGFREGTKPTACLRVILEQRAELKPGAVCVATTRASSDEFRMNQLTPNFFCWSAATLTSWLYEKLHVMTLKMTDTFVLAGMLKRLHQW